MLDSELAKQPLTFSCHQAKIKVFVLKPGLKIWLSNRIRVHKNLLKVQKIADLVDKFLFIWEPFSFVQIPLERWMTILLYPNWQSQLYTIEPHVYPLGNEAKALVNNTFDKF